jgi:hypothetical protein
MKAQKMFEDLGYEQSVYYADGTKSPRISGVTYSKKYYPKPEQKLNYLYHIRSIRFFTTIFLTHEWQKEFYYVSKGKHSNGLTHAPHNQVSMEENKAIQQQLKDLGWIE